MPQYTCSTCSRFLPIRCACLWSKTLARACGALMTRLDGLPSDGAVHDPSDVHGPGLRGRARRLPSSEVCAVHAGSNHDQHPVLTGDDNEPGHAARLWRGLKPVPSIDKASTPGIAVVRDSLGIDYSS